MGRLTVPSPLGPLTLTAAGGRLTTLDWQDAGATDADPVLAAAAEQLAAYFAGRLTAFDLSVAPAGTPFQQRVWQAMREIPFGAAASYGGLALQLGSSARAVGGACARNSLPIVIPCHRILASRGSLGGYSGGVGLETKRWLLRHERCPFAAAAPPAPCPGGPGPQAPAASGAAPQL